MKAEPAAPKRDTRPPLTVRQQLVDGGTFDPVPGTCITCMREDTNEVDRSTGLGLLCWRAHRFGANRAREIKVVP